MNYAEIGPAVHVKTAIKSTETTPVEETRTCEDNNKKHTETTPVEETRTRCSSEKETKTASLSRTGSRLIPTLGLSTFLLSRSLCRPV